MRERAREREREWGGREGHGHTSRFTLFKRNDVRYG